MRKHKMDKVSKGNYFLWPPEANNIIMLYPEPPMKWYAFCFAYFLGLFANDYLLQALFLFALMFFIQAKRIKISEIIYEIFFYLLIFLSFSFGYIYGEQPLKPSSIHSEIENSGWYNDSDAEIYHAKIVKAQSLPDKRWRLILSDITQEYYYEPLKGEAVVYLNYEKSNLKDMAIPVAGMHIQFEAKLREIAFTVNEGILPAENYWHDKNIFYVAYLYMNNTKVDLSGEGSFLANLRAKLYKKLIENCQDDDANISQTKAFIPALIFGERFYFDTETVNLFVKTSLVHSIALSGMHLGFAILCAYFLLKLITFIFPHLLLKAPFTLLLGFISVPLTLLYFWIGNMPISLLRAGLMLFVVWIFLLFYRKATLLDCLVIAATFILLLFPRAWADLSYQFSILSVFAIALIVPYLTTLRKFCYRKLGFSYYNEVSYSKLKFLIFRIAFTIFSLFSISFFIQIFLMPLQVYIFGVVSPYSFFNVLWLPLLQFIILPLSFFSLFTVEFSQVSIFIIDLIASIINFFLMFLAYFEDKFGLEMLQVYRFDIWQGFGYFLLILGLLYRKLLFRKQYIVYLFALLCLIASPLSKMYINHLSTKEERLTIRMLDVGQGQSILLEWGSERAIIDAGGVFGNRFDTGRDIVAKVLTYQDFPHLEYVFLSHFDIDHAKGLVHIAKHFSINNFVYSEYSKDEEIRKEILAILTEAKVNQKLLKTFDVIQLGNSNYYLEVLSPNTDGNYSSNNASMVLRLIYKRNNEIKGLALFCGDIEESGISRLLADNTNNDIDVKILVLPHHGSKDAYSEEFYERTKPEIVIASTGLNNSYNHPSSIVKNYFTRLKIPLYNTAYSKNLSFEFRSGNLLNQ